MRRPLLAALAALGLLAGAGCGDNTEPRPLPDGGPDAPPAKVGPCVDQPTELAMAPTGALPCSLLPPGFVAP